MCNAWNHPVDCTCGWGGEGHLGRRTEGNISTIQARLFSSRRYQSYTIPNTKCPVCGAFVFFYKSENGGSVFFDELGPPWPKHPCTDSIQYKYYAPKLETGLTQYQRDWEKDGWFPVIVESNHKKSNFAFIIERIDKLSDNSIEIMIYGSTSSELTKNDVVVFFKRKDDLSFTLAAHDLGMHKKIDFEFTCEAAKLNKFCNNDPFHSFRLTYGSGF